MSATKLKFEFNKDNFANFIEKIGDLSQISDVIKFKLTKEEILAYSLVASETAVLCLKNYLLPTKNYFKGFEDERTFDLVVSSSSKFVKNCKFFEAFDKINVEIIFKPSYENDEIMHVRTISLSSPASKGDRLRINTVGAELSKIRDLNKDILQKRMDERLCKWQFYLNNNDIGFIKRMSSINSEDKIITISVEKDTVYFSELAKWELQVAECKYKETKINFNKKYLSHIMTSQDKIDFKIFETFILISDNDSNLLLSFETDFTTDD